MNAKRHTKCRLNLGVVKDSNEPLTMTDALLLDRAMWRNAVKLARRRRKPLAQVAVTAVHEAADRLIRSYLDPTFIRPPVLRLDLTAERVG